MRHTLFSFFVLLVVTASCSKKQNNNYIEPVTSSPSVDTSPSHARKIIIDTFKGNLSSMVPYYIFPDSTIFFYVLYDTVDSIHITSNASYTHNDYSTPALINIKTTKHKNGVYYHYGDNITFKQDSILFWWNYSEEMYKGPSGGPIVTPIHLYGIKTNGKFGIFKH